MIISTFFPEKGHGRAEVVLEDKTYKIKYYDDRGHHFFTEDFPNKSVFYVEDTAENWALGRKVLNE